MDCPVCQGSGELELPARGFDSRFGLRPGRGFEHGTGSGASDAAPGDGRPDVSGVFLACYRCGGSGVLEDWE
ncbi:MAG TPA: hypothetical protein VIL22_00865 [Paenibacillaceae bacterium]